MEGHEATPSKKDLGFEIVGPPVPARMDYRGLGLMGWDYAREL